MLLLCLALLQGATRRNGCETAAKKLFNDYCMRCNITHNDFAGVLLSDFAKLEDLFEINIIAYKLKEDNIAELVQKSREKFQKTLLLNVFGNHLNLILHFETYCHFFQCRNCDVLF